MITLEELEKELEISNWVDFDLDQEKYYINPFSEIPCDIKLNVLRNTKLILPEEGEFKEIRIITLHHDGDLILTGPRCYLRLSVPTLAHIVLNFRGIWIPQRIEEIDPGSRQSLEEEFFRRMQ